MTGPEDPKDPPETIDPTQPTEKDKELDEELAETFPGSDPPGEGGPGV